jgi:AcrR family transcriptional regulator
VPPFLWCDEAVRPDRFDERRLWRTFRGICPTGAAVKPTLDSRAERTRAGLLRAFVELIFRDGFENISVHAIVAAAGTARSTFYEHFSSKEDILGASMAHFFNVMADCVTSDVEPAELRWVLEHFWDNRRLVDATFSGVPRIVLARSLSKLIEARLRDGGEKPRLPCRLAAIEIAEAQMALVESWLRGRAYCTPDRLGHGLHRTTRAAALALYA